MKSTPDCRVVWQTHVLEGGGVVRQGQSWAEQGGVARPNKVPDVFEGKAIRVRVWGKVSNTWRGRVHMNCMCNETHQPADVVFTLGNPPNKPSSTN